MATIRDATTVAAADVESDWFAILHDPNATLSTADQKMLVTGLGMTSIANTFTAAQTVSYAGATLTITPTSGVGALVLTAVDNGSSIGNRVSINHNNNATTPAAGHLRIANLGATAYRIWPDTSGNLRIHTADPTNANDTAGTVVGAQTSMAAAKHISDGLTPITEVLISIQKAAAQAVKRFTYKSGAFNGQQFEGVVVDAAPRYGMDRDAEHPAGKSLNEMTLLGDLLRAVAWLTERVEQLENRDAK